jgi:hypothetical protein
MYILNVVRMGEIEMRKELLLENLKGHDMGYLHVGGRKILQEVMGRTNSPAFPT